MAREPSPCSTAPNENPRTPLHGHRLVGRRADPPPGETGEATWRSFTIGDLRVRIVDYSPGYLADHWCDRGHVLFVLEGELVSELRDGRTFTLSAGMSYQVSDFGDAAHRSSTATGAKLFIVD
ncbi:MAG: hypothetical protein JWM65_3376 [Sphingomonas bacterium]|nr:hypothetical protein [Sphingomonas bacterium]